MLSIGNSCVPGTCGLDFQNEQGLKREIGFQPMLERIKWEEKQYEIFKEYQKKNNSLFS